MTISLLVGSGDADNTDAARSWQAALDLWQIEWTPCELDKVSQLRPNVTPVLVVDGLGPNAACR